MPESGHVCQESVSPPSAVPGALGERIPPRMRPPLRTDPRVKVCLAGGHVTTVKGIEPGELVARIEKAKSDKISLLFIESESAPENGVCIDPASVVALIRV